MSRPLIEAPAVAEAVRAAKLRVIADLEVAHPALMAARYGLFYASAAINTGLTEQSALVAVQLGLFNANLVIATGLNEMEAMQDFYAPA